MARSRRNQVHICYGYIPGVTPLVAASATTPDCEPHTPQPTGYIESSDLGPRVYMLRGQPVKLLQRAATRRGHLPGGVAVRAAPINVLIEYAGGRREIRPARGLRKPKSEEVPDA